MKINFLILLGAAFAFSIASQSVSADIVLQFDDFTNADLAVGDATSINGGYQLVANTGQGTGTVGESGSLANIATAANNFNNTGIVSINPFSTTGLADFSTTWVIDSQTGALGTAGGVNFNAAEFLLQGGTAFRNQSYLQLVIDNNGNLDLNVNNGTSGSLFTNADLGAFANVQDGYSLTLDVDATGWAVTGTGFDVNPSQSGVWGAAFDFTDLQTDIHTAATIQSRTGQSIALNVDSINVTTTAVPEPSSLLLLSGVLGMVWYSPSSPRLVNAELFNLSRQTFAS